MVFASFSQTLSAEDASGGSGGHSHSVPHKQDHILGMWSAVRSILQSLPQSDPRLFVPIFLVWNKKLHDVKECTPSSLGSWAETWLCGLVPAHQRYQVIRHNLLNGNNTSFRGSQEPSGETIRSEGRNDKLKRNLGSSDRSLFYCYCKNRFWKVPFGRSLDNSSDLLKIYVSNILTCSNIYSTASGEKVSW